MDKHSPATGNTSGAGVSERAGRWVFWGFALVAAYFLWTEHRAHLLGILPYLLILACPLMHFFHHGKHGHHGHHADAHADAKPNEGK